VVEAAASRPFLSVPITNDVQQRFFSDTTWKRDFDNVRLSLTAKIIVPETIQKIFIRRKTAVSLIKLYLNISYFYNVVFWVRITSTGSFWQKGSNYSLAKKVKVK